MSLVESIAVCLLFGACAGLLAGLFGVGGGLVLVPLLMLLFRVQGFDETYVMLMAVATSLATIIVTALSAIWAHQRHGAIIWKLVMRLAPGIVAGGALGAIIANDLPAATLKTIFAFFMFYVGVQMLLQIKPTASGREPSAPLLALAGTLIGAISAVIGIGGGTLTVPLLAKFNYPMRNAVAVASACGLPIAVSGTLSYSILSWHRIGLPEGSLGYIYLPAFFGIIASSTVFAPIGARLANRLPAPQLKRYFALLLLLVAIKLLWS